MENVINTLHLSGKVVGTPVVGHEAFEMCIRDRDRMRRNGVSYA